MKRSADLDKLTWDQATMLQLATLQGMRALGFNDSTLRNWAHEGHIHPVAKAPGGQFLYHRPTVMKAAEWVTNKRHTKTA
jgi:predicted site-specific integrase-resolvase